MKLGRNDPCWCNSGVKYKRCHLGRESEDPIKISDTIHSLRTSFNKKTCLKPLNHPLECKGGIVRAHTISKSSALSDIAVDGHVYGFDVHISGLIKNDGRMMPKLIGINRASTFSGFCSRHDMDLFKPIDTRTITGSPEQSFLLAYRILARELYGKLAACEFATSLRGHDKGKSLAEQVVLQKMLADPHEIGSNSALRNLQNIKTNYDERVITQNYNGLLYVHIELDQVPEILCSGAIFPDFDFNGNQLHDLNNLEEKLEFLSYHILSSNGTGHIVLSGFGPPNGTVDSMISSLLALGDKHIPQAVVRLAFEYCENTFWSPVWWDSLPQLDKNALINRSNFAVSPMVPRNPNCLCDDGISVVKWRISNTTSSARP